MLTSSWFTGLIASSLLCQHAVGHLTACPTKEITWSSPSYDYSYDYNHNIKNKNNYIICPNSDYQRGGKSLQLVQKVDSTTACATICSDDPRCVKAVYDKKKKICHVKDNANAPQMIWEKDANFDTIRVEDEAKGKFISHCPSKASEYRAKGKATYKVCGQTDYVGASAKMFKSCTSVQACADICSTTQGCKKAVFDHKNNVCHVKAEEPKASLFWVANEQFSTIELASTTSLNTASKGRWSDIHGLPLIPVAAYVAPEFPRASRLLFFSSWGKDAFGGASGRTQFAGLDLNTGKVFAREVADTHHDMFCPGISQLEDGRIIITGGSDAEAVTFYDPATNSFKRGPDMKMPRGYQTSATLSDGKVFTIGGAYSGPRQGKNGEIFDPKSNKWTSLPGADVKPMLTKDHEGIWREDNHAWLFGWKDGSVFQAGPSTKQHWYNTKKTGSVVEAGTRDTVNAMCGIFVMYDAVAGKILSAGGAPDYTNSNANNHAHITTIGDPYKPSKVERVADMAFPRGFSNAVVLPDGTVLVTGGQRKAMVFTNTDGILVPELFNPETKKWTQLAPHRVPRNYHSVSILLPDATVLIGGGGLCYVATIGGSTAKCDKTADHADAEIFDPPYLFNTDGSRAKRPVVSDLTQTPVKAGNELKFRVTDMSGTAKLSLVRMGSVTHSVNSDQRRIPLNDVKKNGNTYTVRLPKDNGVLLPGFYYLFAMSPQGTPSIAQTVHVRFLLVSVSATGILLPLYVYPSAVWNDNAANWQTVISAASSYPQNSWLAVVNPDSGPGGSGQPGNNDINYISGVSQLNALSNVKTVGYVRTDYSTSPMTQLKSNITNYKNWATYQGADLAIDGIFFDESSNNYAYLSEAVTFARQTFPNPITIICNFGVVAADTYYDLCDVVVAFESCLNCQGAPPYLSQATLNANFPTARRPKGAVIVNRFTGTASNGSPANVALLDSYINTIVSNEIGWFYFTSGDYDTITTAPATVQQLAQSLAT
ncbi:Galactose oxidase [Paramyrothecium foliicola]|nr:Galactose oxidase [Paramyrothecium foliicola]